jgi:hypothetical protein
MKELAIDVILRQVGTDILKPLTYSPIGIGL